jgi:aspartate racemase
VAKRIGLLGGISAESTIEYYRRIIRGSLAQRGDYPYPEIVIFSLDFQRFTDLENSGDREGYVAEIMAGIRALEAAGAELLLMAANSPHAVFGEVAAQTKVPMISIVEVTAREARARGLGRLLLLGIRFTMQSTFYQEAFGQMGMEVVTPSESDQDEIERIIFDELARGDFREESRARLLEIIGRYPVEGVILGCTELPLLIAARDVPISLLDTLDLHVRAALEIALAPC